MKIIDQTIEVHHKLAGHCTPGTVVLHQGAYYMVTARIVNKGDASLINLASGCMATIGEDVSVLPVSATLIIKKKGEDT